MTIEYAHLSWTPTSLGADFAAYEIQRNHDEDLGWQRIGYITTEAAGEADDYEPRRGVTAQYRMRVIRTDGAVSAWTPIDTGATSDEDCTIWFTSNEDPTQNQEWTDQRPRAYEFLENTEEVEMHGRDYALVFREMETRGDRFTLALTLNTDDAPVGAVGRQVFQPLIDLARDPDLSYVCVLDSDGNRWQAALLTPSGERYEPGSIYTMPVIVREVSATPSTPDAA